VALAFISVVFSENLHELGTLRMPSFPLPAVIGFLINAGLLVAMAVEDPGHTALGIGAAVVLGIGYALFGKSEREATARATGG
jgi:hydrogenase/urease accessory protein HupE